MKIESVFHISATCDSFKDIPKHLLTQQILNSMSGLCETVWELLIEHKNLEYVPTHLLTEKLLHLKHPVTMATMWHWLKEWFKTNPRKFLS